MKNKWVKFAAVVGFFTLLTAIFTYPAALNLTTHIIGDGGDGFQNLWNIWWFKKSIFELGHHPYFTEYLHTPGGISLLLHTLSPLNIIIALPFTYLFSDLVGYNFSVLFSFAASGVTMFYLAQYLTKNDWAAFVAGCVFSFSAYHFAHTLGHINLLSIQWIPLFTLYLLKVFKDGGFKNALLLGLSLILVALSSWIYLLYAGILGLILLIWYFKDLLKKKKKFIGLGIAALLFIVVIGPVIFGMMKVIINVGTFGNHEAYLWNADISAYFIPGRFSTFGGFFEGIWSNWNGNALEATVFLGYSAIIMSAYALIKVKKAGKWGIVALVFFILSLGSSLRFFGLNAEMPMPYDLISSIPFLNISGVTARYGFMVSFAFAILSAFAVANLKKKMIIPILIILFVLIENLSIPYPVTKVEIPEFYKEIAEDTRDYRIIDVPMIAKNTYMQTIHQKPLIGGYVSRVTLDRFEFLRDTPVINKLYYDQEYDKSVDAQEIFEKFNIKYVILNNDIHLEYVRDELALELVYDKEMKVFDTGI